MKVKSAKFSGSPVSSHPHFAFFPSSKGPIPKASSRQAPRLQSPHIPTHTLQQEALHYVPCFHLRAAHLPRNNNSKNNHLLNTYCVPETLFIRSLIS